MESKTEKCENCIYFEEPLFSLDCDSCVECSNFISLSDFEKDMEIWNEPFEDWQNKPQYFLIKWLINILLNALAENMTVSFVGIVNHPIGEKQNSDIIYYLPIWLKPFFLKEWCDQWRNGGYTGDDYAGHLYYKILPFVYLKFEYQC